MDKGLFERLLYEEESHTLDFKTEQYQFVKATDEEKSELLKDILGFANAFRRSEAFILIGVQEVRGARSDVIGIPAVDHLDDHSLQQFVNNLTNRPVQFHYGAFGYDGKQVGIIRIEEQPRPVYLKRDYGALKKNEVYVRRGSSTDPTKPASPDEIALMGQGSTPQPPELVVEFAETNRDDSLGSRIAWDAEFCRMPPWESIPDLTTGKPSTPLEKIVVSIDPPYLLNEKYYRELAYYELIRRLSRPVRLVVRNLGQVLAGSVRTEITIPKESGAMVLPDSRMPTPPIKRRFLYEALDTISTIQNASYRSSEDLSISENDDRYRIEMDCGDIQPGRCNLVECVSHWSP